MLVMLVAARAQSSCENAARSVEFFEMSGLEPDDIATSLAPLERLSAGQSDGRNCHAWVCLKIADVFTRFQNHGRNNDVAPRRGHVSNSRPRPHAGRAGLGAE